MTAHSDSHPGTLILASRSPRRRNLLEQAGIQFTAIAADLPEPERCNGESVEQYVRRAAELKARSVAAEHPDRLTLAADTVVTIADRLLGQPDTEAAARRMLRSLSGRSHHVVTGVALAVADENHNIGIDSAIATTRVTFRSLTQTEIENYVRSGEPADKAGAYAIQGLGRRLIAGYHGSYTNVVGLPMELVKHMLECPPDVQRTPGGAQ